MPRRRKWECTRTACHDPPYRAGLCQRHYEKMMEKDRKTDEALSLLHYRLIDGHPPESPALKPEMDRLRDSWNECCLRLRLSDTYTVYGENGDLVTRIHESLAYSIIEEERAYRSSHNPDESKRDARKPMWNSLNRMKGDTQK